MTTEKMAEAKEKKPFKDTGFARFFRDKVKPVLGDVVDFAGDVTGIGALNKVGDLLNSKRDEDAAIAALASEFEMKKLEWEMEITRLDHEYRMAEIQNEVEAYRAEIQDRESARDREIEFMRANGGKRDWLMGAVVIFSLVTMVAVIAALVFVDIPDANKDLAHMAFGTVMAIGTQVVAYYVGSSRGSKMKDNTIRLYTSPRD
jgi:hypothetical protein